MKLSSAQSSRGPTGDPCCCSKASEPQSCPFWEGYLKSGPQHLLMLLPVAAGGHPQAATPRSWWHTDCPLLGLGGELSQPGSHSVLQRSLCSGLGCREPSGVGPKQPHSGPSLPPNCRLSFLHSLTPIPPFWILLPKTSSPAK